MHWCLLRSKFVDSDLFTTNVEKRMQHRTGPIFGSGSYIFYFWFVCHFFVLAWSRLFTIIVCFPAKQCWKDPPRREVSNPGIKTHRGSEQERHRGVTGQNSPRGFEGERCVGNRSCGKRLGIIQGLLSGLFGFKHHGMMGLKMMGSIHCFNFVVVMLGHEVFYHQYFPSKCGGWFGI